MRLLHSFSPASQLTLSLASLCLLPSYRTRVPKTPVPGSRRPFPRNCSLERTDDTLMYPTMPRLSRHCIRFGRYLRPFVHNTTFGHSWQSHLPSDVLIIAILASVTNINVPPLHVVGCGGSCARSLVFAFSSHYVAVIPQYFYHAVQSEELRMQF